MNDRTIRTIVVYDPNSAESRKMMESLTENTFVDTIELQRIHGALPGIRAVPAVGVLMWANDLQGVVSDVDALNAYLKHESDTRNVLNEVGIGAIDNGMIERAVTIRDDMQVANRYLPDDVAVSMHHYIFDAWKSGIDYIAGDLRIFNGDLYRCRGTHISDASHDPVNAPSLWRKLPWANVK